jgi:hypothetical protein
MIFVRPYISAIDQRVETVALLALGGVAHVASLFTLGAGRNRYGGSGGSLEPPGLSLRTSIPFRWRVLSAFIPA